MTDLLNEQLSALSDGELPPEETALLLKRIEREPALARRLARYRAMGDVLRGERAGLSADFGQRLSAVVAAEPLVLPVIERLRPRQLMARFLRPVAGLGVAAAVGALAVVLIAKEPGRVDLVAAVHVPPTTTVSVERAASRVMATASLLRASVEPASYVTPMAAPAQLRQISGATLANYVAAHARMSGTLGERDALIHLLSDPTPPEDVVRP